jgi:hypothetical protein
MADPQQPMSEQSGIPGAGSLPDPAAQYRAWLQAQGQGGTQMAPNTQHQVQQPQSQQKERTDYSAQYGNKRAAMKDLSNNIQNLVGQVTQKVQQKKAREQQQIFDRFTQAASGIQQAQSQIEDAKKKLQQNPQDQEALQTIQRAQQSLQQNQTILNDEYNPADPKGQKHIKILQKGFGIDDKNADTPERKAAIQAMQKSMGIGAGPAGVLAKLPQTQQLSPDAQRQQMLQQSGVMGKPATQGQVLNAETQQRGQDIRATTARLQQANQAGIGLDKLKMIGTLKGIEVSRGDGGELVTHVMTPEERGKVPYLKAQDELTAAKTEAERAIVDAKMNPNNPEMKIRMMDSQSKAVDAQARMLAAQAAQMRAMTAQAKEPPEVAAARKDADRLETEYAKAQQYVATPSPTNDTALIFSYVRAQVAGAGRMTNTEIEQALKSGSMGTRYSNMYNRATKGELDSDFRQQLADSIKIAADKSRLTADKYDTKKTQDSISDDEILQGLQKLAQ